MGETVNIYEMECISSEGALKRYKRKSDQAVFTVKTLMVPKNTESEYHPLIINIEAISKFFHPCLPHYYGYATRKRDQDREIYIFVEESEGALVDYVKNNVLTASQILNLIRDVMKALKFVDQSANILPSYITPSNIMVVKDENGELSFKLFGTVYIDGIGGIKEEDFQWMSPELYIRAKMNKLDQTIDAEKAVLYSLGIVALFCGTKDIISGSRKEIELLKFKIQNEEKETEIISYTRAKFLLETDNLNLDEAIGKLLIYPEKERPDFDIWQEKYMILVGDNEDDNLSEIKELDNQNWFQKGSIRKSERKSRPPEFGAKGGCMNQKDSCAAACNIF